MTSKRRGRPRANVPTGTWDDDEVDALLAEVSEIVKRRDERSGEALDALSALLAKQLGRKPTAKQRERMRALLYGRPRSGVEAGERDRTQAAKASAIGREIVAWQRGVGVRDVRWMQDTLRMALDPADRRRSKKTDLTGQPVPDAKTGEPLRDSDGREIKQKPRPRVTMIYR